MELVFDLVPSPRLLKTLQDCVVFLRLFTLFHVQLIEKSQYLFCTHTFLMVV